MDSNVRLYVVIMLGLAIGQLLGVGLIELYEYLTYEPSEPIQLQLYQWSGSLPILIQ